MIPSKVKALVIVFALFLVVGIITVGCKEKPTDRLMNTKSLPGHTFSNYTVQNNTPSSKSSAGILYLGSDKSTANIDFGPKEISFNFKDLK